MSKNNQPSQVAGMGAIVHNQTVSFRVWAPNAKKAYVTGSFNNWKKTTVPLYSEYNGYWSADVPEATTDDEYKFVIYTGDGRNFTRIDPYARQVTNSIGNGVIYEPNTFDWGNDKFKMAHGNELIIYEMHIGTFHVTEEGGPGTFDSAIEKMSYLQELGINAIELMPVAEFPGDFSWGYNPSHPFAIESIYGGPDAFKRFVKAAHKHGLAVIVDVVYNHFGPTDIDLWQFDGWSENEMGGIYFYNDHRANTPWGATRPDYGRGEVRQYIRDNVMMYLEEYHVDGLRWDATVHIKNIEGNEGNPASDLPEGWGLMQWINDEVHDRFPGKILIAEHLPNNEYVTKDTGAGGAGFTAQWDAQFVHPIRGAMITNYDAFRDLNAVAGAIENRYDLDRYQRVIYTESHDEVANGRARIPEEIWPGEVDSWFSRKRSTLGAALMLTTPGIPMLFQGQELLEDRWFHDQDPIEWRRVEEQGGILQLYKDLLSLRRNLPEVTRGLTGQGLHIFRVDHEAKLLAFHRWAEQGPGDSVVVVANMANQTLENFVIGFPRAGIWKTRFNSDSNVYCDDFSNHPSFDVEAKEGDTDGLPCYGEISIGPYTALIFSQDE